MTNVKLISSALVLTVMLSACARQEQEEHEGVIPDGYKSALEKAEGVEGTLQDAMQKQAQEIDHSER